MLIYNHSHERRGVARIPKLKTIFKKKSRSGKFLYYSHKTGKRIPKASYYSRLKAHRTRYLNRTTPKKKARRAAPAHRSKITRRKVSGLFANGTNFTKRVRVFFSTSEPSAVHRLAEKFYQECKKRFKGLKRLMYFHFEGTLYGDDEQEIQRSTRRSYVKEYAGAQFRYDELDKVINELFDLLDAAYSDRPGLNRRTEITVEEPEEFLLKKISINQRN